MDPLIYDTSSVLIYSKYSTVSKQLMDYMNSTQVDFSLAVNLQHLCIDNKEIRKRVLNNKKIHITLVPCILVILPNGGVEKYDGIHAFKWVEDIHTQISSKSNSDQPGLAGRTRGRDSPSPTTAGSPRSPPP